MKATSDAVIASAGAAQAGNKTWWTEHTMSYDCMEFYINFGLPGLIVGFVALGWLIATLDLKASDAERRARFGDVLLFFLPATALVQPLSSIVETSGSAASALIAAFGWRWLWSAWIATRARNAPLRRGPGPHQLVRREADEPARLRPAAEPELP